MNVSLTPELERLVADKVKSGMYQTSSEVIREGLRLLKERDERLESLRSEIRAGLEAVDRGSLRITVSRTFEDFQTGLRLVAASVLLLNSVRPAPDEAHSDLPSRRARP